MRDFDDVGGFAFAVWNSCWRVGEEGARKFTSGSCKETTSKKYSYSKTPPEGRVRVKQPPKSRWERQPCFPNSFRILSDYNFVIC